VSEVLIPVPPVGLNWFLGFFVEDFLEGGDAVLGVEVDEAEVDLVAGELAAVVHPEEEVMFDEARVDTGHALLQHPTELQFDPHEEEDGWGVDHEPGDTDAEEDDTIDSAEEESEEDSEGQKDPDDEDAFVEEVVGVEPDVLDQLL